ncbi:MAG: ABC transporter ATP-binding protein [Actinomycetota bacterium]|nr:ABC transporter ATP-binding protein [Actinomycetota bacterium]
MAEPMIRLDGVSKIYPGEVRAVSDLSLQVPEGEIAVLVGPSGCGKTTILKMINRLVEPTSGRIVVDGTEVRELPPHRLRLRIGYVIQQVGLFPHRTIAQNVATVPRLLGWERSRIDDRVDELLAVTGLSADMRDRYPSELSGGQQQRVGVARALAADPPVLLMDEPFGAVDPIVRGRLQEELLDLQERLRKTIVFVTHDIDEAIRLGDRVAILNLGGALEQYAPPEDVLREPASAFVEEFLGSERGLKRLSLIPVRQLALDRGPVLEPGATAEEAEKLMARYGVDWVGVADGDRLRGWVWGTELDPGRSLGELSTRPFRVRVDPSNSLREALDAVVNSRTRVAVVYDGDRYLGMLTVDQISEEILE